MFEYENLSRIIELQQKSYALLKWVNDGLKRNVLSFKYMHEAMDTSNAAKEWIGRHLNNIPLDIRPEKENLSEFSHLFASYLTTSFELIDKPRKHLASSCECYCTMCSYLVSSSHLKTKKITDKTRKSAYKLKKLYLNSLASENELALIDREITELLICKGISKSISLATYANELIRRSKYASQGEGILLLWREIAWNNGKPNIKYRLNVQSILDAQRDILGRMKEYEN